MLKRALLGRVYSIGVLAGSSPLKLAPPSNDAVNPVLTREDVTDVFATYVADPFMIRQDGTWYMFFEVVAWRPRSKKGEIALATSRDGVHWKYQRIVLAEPFHLSYPYVFAQGSDHYMIPESSAAGSVRLYRADPFPMRWRFVAELVRGPAHFDNSVFHRDGRWWMLTETDSRLGTLRLFHARDLNGPWSEHPKSPVVRADRRIARPAGRVISTPDRVIRLAQDCRSAYGTRVLALEITRLDDREYEEAELPGGPVLAGSGRGWNRSGMHHLDAHRLEDGTWMACADGWCDRYRRPREFVQWAADRWRGA